MKAFHILLMLAAMTAFSCSQKATVEVTNRSGEAISGTIEGAHYLIGAGETASAEVEIGTKFIFGPDEKTVTVTGEGLCVLPFATRVTVQNEDVAEQRIYSNAGLITVNNYSSADLYVYIESNGWGWGEGWVDAYQDGTWRVPVGSYSIEVYFALSLIYYDEDYLDACYEISYPFSNANRTGQLAVAKQRGDEKTAGVPLPVGAIPAGAKRGHMKATSPEKKLCDMVASSKIVPKAAKQ